MADDNTLSLDQLVAQSKGSPSASFVPAAMADLERIQREKEAAVGPEREKVIAQAERDRARVQEKYEGIAPDDIQPWTQKMPERNPIESFGSLGSVFAVLASAFTHTPMINALNGSAAAMTALKAGDEADYKRAFEAWKTNTDLAIKRHQMQHEDFQAAMDMMRTNMELGHTMLQELGTKYGDQATLVMNEAGLYKEMVDVWRTRQDVALRMTELKPRLELMGIEAQLKMADPDIQAYEAAKKKGKVSPELAQKAAIAALRIHQQVTVPTSTTLAGEEGRAIEELVAKGVPRPEAIRRVREESGTGGASIKTQIANLGDADQQITDLLSSLEPLTAASSYGVTGLGGEASRVREWWDSMWGASEKAPATEFRTALQSLKLQIPKLLTGTSRSARDEREMVDQILGGLGPMSSLVTVRTQLEKVQQIIRQRETRLRGEGTESGGAANPYKVGNIVTSPDGKRFKVTGFDPDGTPLGEPVP